MKHSWLAIIGAAVLISTGCGSRSESPLGTLPTYISAGLTDRSVGYPCRVKARTVEGPLEWNPTGKRPWRYIVIHHSSTETGSAESFDAMHRAKGWDELGYHFVIDNGKGGADGLVEIGGRWKNQKWGAHCGGTPDNEYNNYGIGICLVGDFTRSMPTDAQQQAMERLVKHLMAACDIPAGSVIGHREAPNAATDCPGNAFFTYFHDRFGPQLEQWELQQDQPADTMSSR